MVEENAQCSPGVGLRVVDCFQNLVRVWYGDCGDVGGDGDDVAVGSGHCDVCVEGKAEGEEGMGRYV